MVARRAADHAVEERTGWIERHGGSALGRGALAARLARSDRVDGAEHVAPIVMLDDGAAVLVRSTATVTTARQEALVKLPGPAIDVGGAVLAHATPRVRRECRGECRLVDRTQGRGRFARVRCMTCHEEIVVAFSCKRRGLCPSCTARRMADTAAHLVDHVLPRAPYRQWVFTVPKALRLRLARDPAWTTWVGNLAVRAIGAWQRRVARQRDLRAPRTGAITFVQRFG